MLESSIRWVVRKATGSKKGGDYCWSLPQGGGYAPFGVEIVPKPACHAGDKPAPADTSDQPETEDVPKPAASS